MAAGTLFGIGLSQQFDVDGDPIVGGKLNIYQANTLTAVAVWKDAAMTQPQSNPMITDGSGRIPAFWLPSVDGSNNPIYYRAYFTDANNIVVFDEKAVPAIGTAITSGGGGGISPGTGDPTPIEAIAQTGDVKWRP